MSCSLNSKVKANRDQGQSPGGRLGAKPPEAGEKITPEMLRNSILALFILKFLGISDFFFWGGAERPRIDTVYRQDCAKRKLPVFKFSHRLKIRFFALQGLSLHRFL